MIINRLKNQYTIILCIILSALFLAVNKLTGLVSINSQSQYATLLVKEVLLAAFSVALVFLLKENQIFTKRSSAFASGIKVAAFPLILDLLLIISGLLNTEQSLLPIGDIMLFIFFVIAVGIAEEVFCRGIITNFIAQRYAKTVNGVYFSVFLSGIIFGAMHLVNALSGADIYGVIIQAICTIPIGCLYSAIYLRTKNIWIVIFIHAVGDFSSLISSGLYGVGTIESTISDYSLIKIISILVYLTPVFYLLRKSKVDKIVSENNVCG